MKKKWKFSLNYVVVTTVILFVGASGFSLYQYLTLKSQGRIQNSMLAMEQHSGNLESLWKSLILVQSAAVSKDLKQQLENQLKADIKEPSQIWNAKENLTVVSKKAKEGWNSFKDRIEKVMAITGKVGSYDSEWLSKSVLSQQGEIQYILSGLESKKNKTLLWFWVGQAFFLLMVIVLLSWTWKFFDNLNSRIENVRSTFERVSQGHISETIEDRRQDNIGKMVIQINTFLSWFKVAIEKLLISNDELRGSSDQLMSSYKEMIHGTTTVSSMSEESSKITTEVSQNIQNLATSAGKVNDNINTIFTTAESVSESVNAISIEVSKINENIETAFKTSTDAVDISQKALKGSGEASKRIMTLREATGNIARMTSEIKSVAEQTNLLALNAAIEAASAGESGKGFAIVANEIKELALQSAGAVDRIVDNIEQLESNTLDSVSSIKEVEEVTEKMGILTNDIAMIIHTQKQQTNKISESIDKSVGASKEMAESICQILIEAGEMATNSSDAAKGAGEVAVNIGDLSNHAQKNASHLKQVSQSAKALTKSIKRLKRRFAIFNT